MVQYLLTGKGVGKGWATGRINGKTEYERERGDMQQGYILLSERIYQRIEGIVPLPLPKAREL